MKKYTPNSKVAIVVVTYNRRDYVLKNIEHIKNLLFDNYEIIVFDNGSSDGTEDALFASFKDDIQYYKSNENLGGAGGFKKGMAIAYDAGFEYIWCLDDDGAPHKNSLTILLKNAQNNKSCIYGTRIIPIGASKDSSFWEINGGYDKNTKNYIYLSEDEKVSIIKNEKTHITATVALLGLFIHRSVIDSIGYPNEKLFLANDDVEYCLRAWSCGIPVKLVMKATVEHPPIVTIEQKLFFKKVNVIKMPPWKLYYYIRNIIYVNRKYFKFSIYMKMCFATLITVIVNIKMNKALLKPYIRSAFLAYKDGIFKTF